MHGYVTGSHLFIESPDPARCIQKTVDDFLAALGLDIHYCRFRL
jgi:hypothetical protein